jgi:hypothetical protein
MKNNTPALKVCDVPIMNTKGNKKDYKSISEIKSSISEELHYLLNEGMSHEEIVLFLEELKLDWIAKNTYDILVGCGWIKEPVKQ